MRFFGRKISLSTYNLFSSKPSELTSLKRGSKSLYYYPSIIYLQTVSFPLPQYLWFVYAFLFDGQAVTVWPAQDGRVSHLGFLVSDFKENDLIPYVQLSFLWSPRPQLHVQRESGCPYVYMPLQTSLFHEGIRFRQNQSSEPVRYLFLFVAAVPVGDPRHGILQSDLLDTYFFLLSLSFDPREFFFPWDWNRLQFSLCPEFFFFFFFF